MPVEYSPNGETITRADDSTVYPVVYLDESGAVVGKAYIPEGHRPEVPDAVDDSRSFTLTSDTDLSSKLADSPANLPSDLPHDPAETAMEKVENVAIDDAYTTALE